MPPAPPDSPVGRVSAPEGAARRIRTPRRSQQSGRPGLLAISETDSPEDGSENRSEKKSKASSALETLLVDLGSQIHRGDSLLSQGEPQGKSAGAAATHRHCPTGLEMLDARLGGGFPIGRLSEICGAPSSGRTSLALTLLAETLNRGVLAAWLDLADAVEPASADLASSDLERLLWVRARSADEALRSCERLLQTEGFELIILDLAIPPTLSRASVRSTYRSAIRDTSWLRLARKASGTRTALVAISNSTLTGSRAELILEMKPLAARFVGPPNLLDTLETTAVLQRHRSRPIGHEIPLRVHADDNHSNSETTSGSILHSATAPVHSTSTTASHHGDR